MSKITLASIQEAVSAQNWKVISTNYTNLTTEMTFQCPEGHNVYTSWKKLRDKYECPLCKTNAQYCTTEILPKSAGAHRILALDQASHTTGFAIFDNDRLIKYGAFTTSQDDEIARCASIKEWLLSIIRSYQIDFVGLEGIQFQEEGGGRQMGVTVFQTLAHLQGILMEACYEAKVPYKICPTNTWRHVCGVKGRTRTDKKRSMQLLVKQWYDVSPTDDESDAIGIGYYLTKQQTQINNLENWEQ